MNVARNRGSKAWVENCRHGIQQNEQVSNCSIGQRRSNRSIIDSLLLFLLPILHRVSAPCGAVFLPSSWGTSEVQFEWLFTTKSGYAQSRAPITLGSCGEPFLPRFTHHSSNAGSGVSLCDIRKTKYNSEGL